MTTTHWQGPSRYLPFERVLTQIGLHFFWSGWLAVDVAVLIEHDRTGFANGRSATRRSRGVSIT